MRSTYLFFLLLFLAEDEGGLVGLVDTHTNYRTLCQGRAVLGVVEAVLGVVEAVLGVPHTLAPGFPLITDSRVS
jgi:hypothetical protein